VAWWTRRAASASTSYLINAADCTCCLDGVRLFERGYLKPAAETRALKFAMKTYRHFRFFSPGCGPGYFPPPPPDASPDSSGRFRLRKM
jgi:hypothetical protein